MADDTTPVRRHVAIVANGVQFPQGMAGTQRIKLLARGLCAYGDKVTVLTLQGTEASANVVNTATRGTYQGVDFEYTCGTTISSASYLVRRWRDVRGYTGALWRLWRMKRSGALDVVFLYTRLYLVVRVFCAWCRLLRVPVILEVCEWPESQLRAGHGRPRAARRFCDHAIALVDATVPISSYIEEIVRAYCRTRGLDLPLLRLPVIVDGAGGESPPPQTGQYLTLCAAFAYQDMHTLALETCAELKRRNVSCRMKILGGYGGKDLRAKFEDFARRLDIADRVEILGYVDDAELKRIYTGSLALLAPLPDVDNSAARFPQKLAEYAASGRPIVTTPVGEVPHYLTDGVSAFFAATFTKEAMADCIQRVLEDPQRADAVGAEGRKVAQSEFSYLILGRRLGGFIEDLVSKRKDRRQ